MTATSTVVAHEWRVVAPWWFWPRRDTTDPLDPGDPDDRRAVRVSRPELQKYNSPNLVNTFLASPQLRLEFNTDTDEVWEVAPGNFGSMPKRTQTRRRKLYLGTHHRHYLVVCSLHCDAPGFPHARTDDVCEAGMVVRRRVIDLPGGPQGEAAAALRRHAVARRKRAELERRLAAASRCGPVDTLRSAVLEGRLQSLRSAEADARRTASQLTNGVRLLQGWVPTGVDAEGNRGPMPPCAADGPERTPLPGIGAWLPVEEMPGELTESSFSLGRLFADPTKTDHDATGETIYFGVVPTGSSDLDDHGDPRFDDHHIFEIRCFVRRHLAECPRSGGHCKCPITYSEPTQAYQLAPHFDLEGTANRPVTVQLPDLAQLHADSVRLSPGGAGGVRFQSPPNSELAFTADDLKATAKPGAAGNADFQICSFAIPLLTIVAFFVFQLFLPVVVFIFQLWFLLTLRFCIPPDVSLEGQLATELDAIGAGVDIDAGAVAQIEGDADFRTKIDELLGTAAFRPPSGPITLAKAVKDARSANQLDRKSFGSLARGMFAYEAAAPKPQPYVKRVEREEVVRP